MRVITKVKGQKKNKDRFSIFINDEYAFSVSKDILANYHLYKGKTLAEREISELIEADSLHRAYVQAIHYLSYRMRSVQEVVHYLERKDIPTEQIEQTIIRLLDEGLLDDAKYAQAFIIDSMNQTSKGPLLIKNDLIKKGVNEQVIDENLVHYPYQAQFDKALKWIGRRIKQTQRDSYRKRIEKMHQGLMQRGFTSDVITDVIDSIKEKIKDGTEWEALVYHGNKQYKRLKRRYDDPTEQIYRLKVNLFQRGFPRHLVERFINTL